MAFLTAIAGLILFIGGMEFLSKGILALNKYRLQTIINRAAGNTARALLAGALITGIVQSSSLTTVLAIGLLQAKTLKMKEAMALVIGANIGTTITAQLVAFDISGLGPWLLLLSPAALILLRKNRGGAGMYAGLALLLTGLDLISSALLPLLNDRMIKLLVTAASASTLAGIIGGAVIVALIQSSSAMIAVVQSIAAHHGIGLPAALSLVAGANVGTCVTALLAASRADIDGKRLALWHLAFNLGGSLLFISCSSLFARGALLTSAAPARQIANGHLLFNLAAGCLYFPLIPRAAPLLQKWTPYRPPGSRIL